MPLDNNLDGKNEIAHFLEKFKEQEPVRPAAEPDLFSTPEKASVRPSAYARSFEKLEQKIHELEEKFEASTTQNHLILSELSRTREAMERQKDKDAFLEHLSRTISTLRTSVENLTRAQETHSFSYREIPVQRSFDPLPAVQPAFDSTAATLYAAEKETARLRQEREEQDRLFNSLRQKASQLKAVNSALDREIKKAQQEKLDALKKSADQAKEILSLRDQLTAAEERFKSFDFEGRIISIKREYQQKVSTLETQLKEMSDTCMRQVEEIESLKAKNTELQAAAAEKETLQAQLAEKDKQLTELKAAMAALQTQQTADHEKQVADYTARLRTLEEQRAELSLALEKSQVALGTLRREKELLENNFKELMIKINQNDSVIGQMKEKIDVLARQNTELTHQNTALAQRNQELSQTTSDLMSRNETLAQTNVHLTRDNQTLSQNNAVLTKDKETLVNDNAKLAKNNEFLAQNNAALARDNEALSQNNANLARDNEALSKNNAHLMSDNQTLTQNNAALARDKETLTAHNANLTRDKEALANTNARLAKNNEALSHNNAALAREKESLSKNNAALVRDKEALSKHNADLKRNNEELTKTNLNLTRNNEVLAQKAAAPRPQIMPKKAESKAPAPTAPTTPQAPIKLSTGPVRPATAEPKKPAQTAVPGRSAALLAARLVQEHAQKTAKAHAATSKTNSPAPMPANPAPGVSPRAEKQAAGPVLHSLGRTLQQVSVPAEEEWEVVSAKAPTAVRTEEDLPEIRVADPVPQDNLFDGEDFLDKTSSFIGRMKWSIFREHH